MYELAVCSDGMTEAQPRSFRQHVHLKAKKNVVDNFDAALTGKVQVLVTLTTKHDWARMDPQV